MSVVISMTIFVLSHIVLARTRLRAALVTRIGERAYLILYSGLSIILIGWVIWTVLEADRFVLWEAPLWSYGFAAVVTFVSFVLLGVGALSSNPLSVSFRKEGFDPNHPGLVGWVRHPIILGLALWGLAHIPANGDWPSLVLFAGTAGFGALGIIAVEKRIRHRLGEEEWNRLTSERGHIDRNVIWGAVIGIIVWIGFLTHHHILFAADPLAILLQQHWE